MIDIIKQLEYVHRQLEDGDELKTIVLRRHYDAAIDDVWDACTSAERIPRWFLPIKGDLRVGGRYQLEGNAGGEVLACEPPRFFKVTWIFGDAPGRSEVEVRLSADGDERTLFELRHTAAAPPDMWDQYGPGAVGVGWDLALLGLAIHMAGESLGDPSAWEGSDEARAYSTTSSRLWGEAHQAAGAPADQAKTAAANTATFYAP